MEAALALRDNKALDGKPGERLSDGAEARAEPGLEFTQVQPLSGGGLSFHDRSADLCGQRVGQRALVPARWRPIRDVGA